MNLMELLSVCAAYHGVELSDLIKESVNLGVIAANNARKKAEKLNDFVLAECTATLDIDGVNGGDLGVAVIAPTGVFSGVKTIRSVSGLRSGGDFVPLDFTTASISIERDRTEIELNTDGFRNTRYPSDAQFEAYIGFSGIVQRGNFLYRFPRFLTGTSTPLTVYAECYGWLNDYTKEQAAEPNAEPQDFFLEHGFEYLQWAIIIELNYLFKTFVPRQEGNLTSPDRMLEQAWRDLLLWDSFLIPPNATSPR